LVTAIAGSPSEYFIKNIQFTSLKQEAHERKEVIDNIKLKETYKITKQTIKTAPKVAIKIIWLIYSAKRCEKHPHRIVSPKHLV
jgi:hypothetical protein